MYTLVRPVVGFVTGITLSTFNNTVCSTMTGFKTFICSCVYFHFHTDDGLSKNRNVCTYCYAHKIMKFITFALTSSLRLQR